MKKVSLLLSSAFLAVSFSTPGNAQATDRAPTIQEAQAAIVAEQDGRFKEVAGQEAAQTEAQAKASAEVLQKYETALRAIKVTNITCKPSGHTQDCLVSLIGPDGTKSDGNVFFVRGQSGWVAIYPDSKPAE